MIKIKTTQSIRILFELINFYHSKFLQKLIVVDATDTNWKLTPRKTKGLIDKNLNDNVELVENNIIKTVPQTGNKVKMLGYCISFE